MYNHVKISSIFDYMQESASIHAESLHFGYEDMKKAELLWVLSRAIIKIDHYPSAWEEITVETWPKNINGYFANRDFRFYDATDKCIGSATTAWLMLNRTTFRPVKPELLLNHFQYSDFPPGIDEFPEKLPESVNKSFVSEICIGYKDIDINLHTNNARYIEYLTDCCSEQFNQQKQIQSMQINFLYQTRTGDVLKFYINNDDSGKSCIEAEKEDGIKVFNSMIFWK